ncbi:MAG: hypothetical protein GY853_14085 [PVC group bacterium]|nr:hypothetical protein [PVC group bacterium]
MNKSPAIKVKPNIWDSKEFEKPYHGARRNRGMPSAMEPIQEYTEQGRKNFDKCFKQEDKVNNCGKVKKCKKNCEYRSMRTESECAWYIDIDKCDTKKVKKPKLLKVDYRPPLTGMGIYDK